MFEFEGIFSVQGLANIALVSLVAPRAEALITPTRLLDAAGPSLGAVLRSIWRSALLVGVYSAVFNPLVWLFILPFISLPTRMQKHGFGNPFQRRRRLRRLWAEQARAHRRPSVRMDPTKTKPSKCKFTSNLSSVFAPQKPLKYLKKVRVILDNCYTTPAEQQSMGACPYCRSATCPATRFAIRAAVLPKGDVQLSPRAAI